jgi:hypothetical protein
MVAKTLQVAWFGKILINSNLKGFEISHCGNPIFLDNLSK